MADPTPTGPALDAMAEALFLTDPFNRTQSPDWPEYIRLANELGGFMRQRVDALRVQASAILARLAEPRTDAGAEPSGNTGELPSTCKDGLQVAAPGDFEPAGRAIFVRLGASTIDAFHPAYERNADLFEQAARDAIALRPRAFDERDGGRLREAGFIDDPYADLWSIVREEDEDLRVRAGRDYVVALRAALAQAGQDGEGEHA